jgi:serine phosphatase RsbU (regulator of sigma subunit)
MTIRSKVRIGMGLILALFVALSAFAIDRVGTMARHWSGLSEAVIPTLTLSGEMSMLLDRLRVLETTLILEQNPDHDRALRIEIEKAQARLFGLMAEYHELSADPAQDAPLHELAVDLRSYVMAFEKTRDARVNNAADAVALLRTSAPIHTRLIRHIDDLDELSRRHAERASEAGFDVGRQAKVGALIAVAMVAFIMLTLIVVSNRTILSPMQRLIGAIDLLADGQLATQVPFSGRRDELGDVARALEHFRENAVEKERLQKQEQEDLAFARRIQLASVPQRFPAYPDRPELDVAGRLAPTRAVGGDFFDFYFVDSRHLAIAIGDASGKGIASAMFVGVARSALRSEGGKTIDPALCLREANRLIASDNEEMMFMTTFYGILDLETGDLTYANAGHLPPYLLKHGQGVTPMAITPGLPLGVVDEFTFEPMRLRLAPGDAIALYTDGVTEAADPAHELFGEPRLEDALSGHYRESCDAIVGRLFEAVHAFANGAPQADDIAVLVVRYNGPAAAARTQG